jgi:spore coat polysaccharide biosynthesis protein SpsF
MKNFFALVTARMSSTRLPKKCMMSIANEVSLIQVVIRRAKQIGCPVILATSNDSSDDQLEEVAKTEGVYCFRGALLNKILRWKDCFEEYDISHGLLVDGDDPTFDYNVGKRALEMLYNGDSDLIVSHPDLTPGFFTYGISRIGIKKLYNIVPDNKINTDVITEYIEQAQLTKIFVKPKAEENLGHNIRLTIDYPEDIEFYQKLYELIDYMEPGPEIVKACLANELQNINWHKHDEFLKNQEMFNQKAKSNLKVK